MILELWAGRADDYDHVTDRAGHDLRYAIDSTKLRTELGWQPAATPTSSPGWPRPSTWYRDARGLVAPAQGRDRGDVRRAGAVTMAELKRRRTTPIPGLLRRRRSTCTGTPAAGSRRTGSARRWSALGLPDFGAGAEQRLLQRRRGATRGIHAEPWDKFVSVATGRIFGAWVDLREGRRFGADVHRRDRPARRGLRAARASATPTRRSRTARPTRYLVNDHWRPGAGLHRPQPRGRDRRDPVADPARRGRDLREGPGATRAWTTSPRWRRAGCWSLGADGPAGPGAGRRVCRTPSPLTRAAARPHRRGRGRPRWPWRDYDAVVNAAAYTAVDAAETEEGRRDGLGRQRHRRRGSLARPRGEHGSRSCTTRPTTSSTARVDGHDGGRAALPARRLRPDQGRRRRGRRHRAAALHRCGRRG